MKFYCDNCQAKYSIADEKVRGKVLKVRCKKCSSVITVREPRAPVAAQQMHRPTPAATLPWYYALNGQTFGPYEEAALMRMFESGELGDACYIWNETFTEWLPVRQVPSFVPALEHGSRIRPRNKTIGVSGALEAVKIDQLEPAALKSLGQVTAPDEDEAEEEAGVVPGQMADRIESLRERLKQHQRTPDTADESPFGKKKESPFEKPPVSLAEKKPAGALFTQQSDEEAEDSTTQMSVAEISGLLDMPEGLGGGSTEAIEDFHIEADEELPTLDGGENLMDSLFPTNEEDGVPAFIGTSEESVIDFSRLEQKEDEQTSHDGLFAESAASFTPPNQEPEQFQTSNSLLIQMDSIQKEGRSKRVVLIGVVALLFVGIGIVAVIASKNVTKDPDANDSNVIYDEGKKELTFKKYGEDERRALLELGGEEVISADTPIEDEPEEEPGEVVAKNGGKKPELFAQNSVKTKKTTPDLRGMDALLNSKSKQNDALNSSSSKGTSSGSGLNTKKDGGGKAIGSTSSPTAKKNKFDNLPRINGSRKVRGPSIKGVNTGESSKPDTPQLGQAGTLSKDDARKGFKKVSRSVQSCYQKQVRRGLPLDAAKVHVTLEIKGTGKVVGLTLAPASVRSSEFANCMESHRKSGRWPFAEFGGKTLKIKHTYVLQ